MANEESEKAEQGAQSNDLLAQHRELHSLISKLEKHLASPPSEQPTRRAELSALLLRLLRAVELHFEAESESLRSDFDDDPQLRAVFQELDRDHPALLDGFRAALTALQRQVPLPDATLLIRQAIAAFRKHEAEEEVLFSPRAQ